MESRWPEQRLAAGGGGSVQLPESPTEPMQFLSRTWSPSALQLSKTLVAPLTPKLILPKKARKAAASGAESGSSNSKIEEVAGAGEAAESAVLSGNTFSFASSATSQLVLERIMSQSVSFKHIPRFSFALFLSFLLVCFSLVLNLKSFREIENTHLCFLPFFNSEVLILEVR